MFDGKDVKYKGKNFPLKTIKGLKRYDVGNLLFIEQTKKSNTEWAKRALKGSKIMWIIDIKFDRYLVRVEDSKITRLNVSSNNES